MSKKRIYNRIMGLLTLLLLISLLPTVAHATEASVTATVAPATAFTVENGVITAYSGQDTHLEIPGTIDGQTVTEIAPGVFQDNKHLVKVGLPDTVTTVGENLFRGCSNLKQVTLSANMTQLADYLFYECTALESVTLPPKLERINVWAFGFCKSLKQISLPPQLQFIDPAAFYACESLLSIDLPESVTYVNTHAFRGCRALSQVTLSPGMTTITFRSFSGCAALKTLDIPAEITAINKEAFYNAGLETVTGGEGLNTIESDAFFGCSDLTSFSQATSIVSIGDRAFQDCYKLSNISLAKVENIGSEAFAGCSVLQNLTLDAIQSIGQGAFADCQLLRQITLPETLQDIEEDAFRNCPSLLEIFNFSSLPITLEEDTYGGIAKHALAIHTDPTEESLLQTEGEFTFWTGNSPLLVTCETETDTLTLPEDFRGNPYGIYSYAFAGCPNLKKLTLSSGVNRLYPYALDGTIQIVYIPTGITIDSHVFHGNNNLYRVFFEGDRVSWKEMDIAPDNDLDSVLISYILEDQKTVIENKQPGMVILGAFRNIGKALEENIFIVNYLLILFWGVVLLYARRQEDTLGKKKQRKQLFVALACLQWILISGLRSDMVGADTETYMQLFRAHSAMRWDTLFQQIGLYFRSPDMELAYEPAYLLLEKLIGTFTSSHTVYKFIIAIIFMTALGNYVYRYSDDPCMSFLLYNALFYNMFSLTGYRQVVAVALVGLYGYQFIRQRRPIPFLICLVIGSLFHRTTLIFILFYLLGNKKITRGYVLIMSIMAVVMIIFRTQLFNFMKVLMDYEQYSGDYGFAQGTFMLLFIAFTAVTIYRYPKIAGEDTTYLCNGLILAWLMFPFAMVSPSSMRLVYNFGFVMLPLLPKVLKSFPGRNEKIVFYLAMIAVLGYFVFTRAPIYQFA